MHSESLLSPNQQLSLRSAIENGLPLTPQPYKTLAEQLGVAESQVISTIEQWMDEGLVRRFGLVVRHRELGYRANAMVVWNIADEQVKQIGRLLADEAAVTLCYRRARQLPQWPYNLFCMIHGRSRDQVVQQLALIVEKHQLQDWPKELLFSTHAYKQCGARYSRGDKCPNRKVA